MRKERTIIARHYVPGGREHGGGIGRLIGYIVDAAARDGEMHAVTDTRGPRWSVPASPILLCGAILTMFRDRVAAPDRIHHIHIAGRGSTIRKLILTGVARALGCAHILHLHDYDYAGDVVRRPRWQQALVRRMFKSADRVLVLGVRDGTTAVRLLGVAEERIVIVRNCVPDPGPRRRRVAETPIIIFLGRLGERKGTPELLEALSSPTMASLRWHAVLAGDGPVEDYRRRAEQLGLAGRVDMPGWLSEPGTQALCASADILVLPSHGEGMAMSVLEGLAHGLAVVTTRVGAHEESITDNVSGAFVPVGDPAALAEALARLVTEPSERARLAEGARAVYLARFSMQAYLQALDAVYDEFRSPAHRQTVAAE